MSNVEFKVKYCKPAPVTLRRWLDANTDKVVEFDCGGGYGTDNGFAYDVLLRSGWSMCDDAVHTLIEPTVKDMLSQLRSTKRCDCESCKEESA